jgi:hypothetical protein
MPGCLPGLQPCHAMLRANGWTRGRGFKACLRAEPAVHACALPCAMHPHALLVAQCRCVPACMHPHTACTPRAPMHHPSMTTARSPHGMHAAPCMPLVAPLISDRCTAPTAHMRAAPSRTMPPVRQQNWKKLVRKLGANSQPGEQAQALAEICKACRVDPDLHFRAAIVAVGAIPVLVPLLGPGSPAELQQDAAFVLWLLSEISENVATIAAAGAIPLLVQLLKPGSPAYVQAKAAALLMHIAVDDNCVVTIASAGAIPHLVRLMAPSSPVLVQVSAVSAISALARHAGNAAIIAAAGAIPLLVQFLDPGDGPPAVMQYLASGTLGYLAVNAEDAATITSAGAVPLLVQLLKPGGDDDVPMFAADALGSLAATAETAVTIAAAGAIPLLAQLLKPGSDDATKAAATQALEALRKGVAVNRAAVAAAKAASADLVQAMEGLGVGCSSGVQTII